MSPRHIQWIFLSCAAIAACRSRGSSEQAPTPGASTAAAATSAAAPLAFQFAKLPSDYARVELYGPASETVLAPKGARVTKADAAVSVQSGDYVLTVSQGGPSQQDFKQKLRSYGVQDAAPDVLVYREGDKFNFRTLLTRTPEWDDTPRRYACSGGPAGDPPQPSLSKAQVELLVSACRSLELPALE